MLFERVLAKRELVSEVIREKSREGIVETPEICEDSRAGRERMKVCSSESALDSSLTRNPTRTRLEDLD
jgi:hypothetical protein